MTQTTSLNGPASENVPLEHKDGVEVRDAKTWARLLAPYRRATHVRGAFELAVTVLPFVMLWAGAVYAYSFSVWLSLLMCVPLAGLLLRLFVIQHDCGHGSFFPSKRWNDIIGSVLAVPTVTPYFVWKQAHKQHHATSGNLDRRGIGAINTLTVAEYQARTAWGRIQYRLYRNPVVLFLIGPAYVFLLQNRLPIEFLDGGWRYWLSAMATNLGIAGIAALLIWAIGWGAFLAVFLSTTILAAMIGVWLFYVQHQFEETHWRRGEDWNVHEAALDGSSYYDLPGFLPWLTGYIGVHHVHHLNSRIPLYRLSKTVKDFPELKAMNRLTLWSSLASINLHLWDEVRGRLVSFGDAKLA